MSTSATQSGTTTRAGRSGKGLGIAVAALAVVIAAGFVFTVNQGNNEVTVSAAERAARIASDRWDEMIAMNEAAYLQQATNSLQGESYLDALNERAVAEKASAESHPGFNIEKTKMELAGQLGGSVVRDEGNLDMIRAQQAAQAALLTEHPGVNPERTQMLIDKLDEQLYVPSIVQPVVSEPAELNLPEWDNRIP